MRLHYQGREKVKIGFWNFNIQRCIEIYILSAREANVENKCTIEILFSNHEKFKGINHLWNQALSPNADDSSQS